LLGPTRILSSSPASRGIGVPRGTTRRTRRGAMFGRRLEPAAPNRSPVPSANSVRRRHTHEGYQTCAPPRPALPRDGGPPPSGAGHKPRDQSLSPPSVLSGRTTGANPDQQDLLDHCCSTWNTTNRGAALDLSGWRAPDRHPYSYLAGTPCAYDMRIDHAHAPSNPRMHAWHAGGNGLPGARATGP